MKLLKQLALHVAALGILSNLAMALETTLQNGSDGYEGAASTIVIAGIKNADLNFGGLGSILVGAGTSVERRALLFFDLTSLAGSKVSEDAILELRQANVRGFEEGVIEIAVYRIASANAGWKGGTGRGEQEAQDGEASWNHYSGGAVRKRWAGSPGLSKAGIDFDEQALTIFPYEAYNPSSIVRVSIPKEVIQQWIDDPKSNAGMLFRRHSNSSEVGDAMGGFNSVNHIKPDHRPKLIVVTE